MAAVFVNVGIGAKNAVVAALRCVERDCGVAEMNMSVGADFVMVT